MKPALIPNALTLVCAVRPVDNIEIEDSGPQVSLWMSVDDAGDERLSQVKLSHTSAAQLRDWLTAWLEATS